MEPYGAHESETTNLPKEYTDEAHRSATYWTANRQGQTDKAAAMGNPAATLICDFNQLCLWKMEKLHLSTLWWNWILVAKIWILVATVRNRSLYRRRVGSVWYCQDWSLMVEYCGHSTIWEVCNDAKCAQWGHPSRQPAVDSDGI